MSLSRFDDLVQTERNFSATLLPLVLFPDDFRGLREFVRLVDERTSWERHADGNAVPREEQETHLPERLDGDYLELITEFHIARDLRAGNQVPPDDDPADERVKKDAPDMVIVLGDEVLVCEAKFIGNWTVDKLATQMASQRAQIARLFVARPALRAYRHVAIVPRLIPLDTDAVVTWQDIACLAKSLPAPKYVTERLERAVARYVLPGAARVQNWDGSRLPLHAVIAEVQGRQARRLRTQIGYQGGWNKFCRATYADLAKRWWKPRYPDTNQVRAIPNHWITENCFLERIELIKARPEAAHDGSTSLI
ncbi:MAG: hypothetical protein H0V51_02100 [Chloroflexi bacterium]|nr:hypothetical protein [Chloroflexota bacterium]